MPGRKGRGRPWGNLRGNSAEANVLAELMRAWLDEAGLTQSELRERLEPEHFVDHRERPGRATVSDWLAGVALRWDFIEAVIDICSTSPTVALERRTRARGHWQALRARARATVAAEPAAHNRRDAAFVRWMFGGEKAADPGDDQQPSGDSSTAPPDLLRDVAAQVVGTQRLTESLTRRLVTEVPPMRWPGLLGRLRAVAAHPDKAEELLIAVARWGAPGRIGPLVEALRESSRFGDDRLVMTTLAQTRDPEDLLRVLDAARREHREDIRRIYLQHAAALRAPEQLVALVDLLRERDQAHDAHTLLQLAGRWRPPPQLLDLGTHLLRAERAGDATTAFHAAGATRSATSLPDLLYALRRHANLRRTALDGAALERAPARIPPLLDTLGKHDDSRARENAEHILDTLARHRDPQEVFDIATLFQPAHVVTSRRATTLIRRVARHPHFSLHAAALRLIHTSSTTSLAAVAQLILQAGIDGGTDIVVAMTTRIHHVRSPHDAARFTQILTGWGDETIDALTLAELTAQTPQVFAARTAALDPAAHHTESLIRRAVDHAARHRPPDEYLTIHQIWTTQERDDLAELLLRLTLTHKRDSRLATLMAHFRAHAAPVHSRFGMTTVDPSVPTPVTAPTPSVEQPAPGPSATPKHTQYPAHADATPPNRPRRRITGNLWPRRRPPGN
ncbi:hypothetical protein [Embleya sp. NPDC001921]